MPVRRLHRRPMIGWLESFQRHHPGLPFGVFVIAAYRKLNPEFSKVLSKNFSFLEAVTAYAGRYLLLENGRPDRNILYYFALVLKRWNDRPANITRQIRKNPYDFPEIRDKTSSNPDGMPVRVTYRFLEPERGDDAVNLTQTDLDNTSAGIAQTRERLEQSRDPQVVDISIEDLLKEYGLQ